MLPTHPPNKAMKRTLDNPDLFPFFDAIRYSIALLLTAVLAPLILIVMPEKKAISMEYRIVQSVSFWLIALFLAVVAGCSDEQQPKKQVLDKKMELKVDAKLMGISKHAGLTYTDMHLQKDLNCLIDDSSDLCKLYKQALLDAMPVFEKIKHDGQLSKELFYFAIFLPYDDSGDLIKKEWEIGLFSSLSKCQEIEVMARNSNIPTRKCNAISR